MHNTAVTVGYVQTQKQRFKGPCPFTALNYIYTFGFETNICSLTSLLHSIRSLYSLCGGLDKILITVETGPLRNMSVQNLMIVQLIQLYLLENVRLQQHGTTHRKTNQHQLASSGLNLAKESLQGFYGIVWDKKYLSNEGSFFFFF